MKKITVYLLVLILTACNIPANVPAVQVTATPLVLPTSTHTPISTETSTPTSTFTPLPTETSTATPVPVVESLDAIVTVDNLSCRYGPGSEYLYFTGFKKGLKLKIIGRTDGNNWVMVKGKKNCWVNEKFIEIKGDKQMLKVTYPAEHKLPVSSYYAAPIVLSAIRTGNKITVSWSEVILRPGDEEDESMFIYIIEVWRCEGGQIIFDPLASNYPEAEFIDEPGCDIPSHGRVFFQEKHGFAGPSEIPWPK